MQLIAHYQVRREIARGGMGVVYHAWDPQLERDVAIKVILAAGQVTPEDLERFRTEARATARLRHPHIVAIHGVGLATGGQPFLVMDLIEGGSLKSRIDAEGPLPIDDATRITREVADALQFAHERGVLHRDVKPHNILLDPAGRAFLTDFGLAKLLNLDTGITLSGELVGTPVYMAPEQANADTAKIGRASDVYALGGTLYHMLTGKPPFSGTTVVEVLNKVLSHDPEAPSTLRAGVDEALEAACLRCLNKEPHERFESASALAEALAPASSGQTARPGTPHGAWKLLAATAVSLAVGGAAGFVAGSDQDRLVAADRRIQELERGAENSTTQLKELAEVAEAAHAQLREASQREIESARMAAFLALRDSADPNLIVQISGHLLAVGTSREDTEQVLLLTEKLLKATPGSARGHATRGRALIDLGRFDEGIRSLRQAKRIYSDVATSATPFKRDEYHQMTAEIERRIREAQQKRE